ncbi:MAG: DUF4982 domain-containing protein [Lachnospiraceae bacterium]|nr:DUF4982 domain-containing protein [Lachnospiraceae bacterium]
MRLLFNGEWKFLETKTGTVYQEAMERLDDFVPVQVPHDWLIFDAKDLYRDGCGWYFKKAALPAEYTPQKGKKLFLCFDGVYMDCALYVNDQKAGEWKYGYSPFTMDITAYVKEGDNRFVLSVTHQNPNSRWYSGAGIFRNVQLFIAEETYIPQNGIYVHSHRENDHYFLQVETEIATTRQDVSPYAAIPEIGNYQLEYVLLDETGQQVDLTKLSENYREVADEILDVTGNGDIRTVKVTSYRLEKVNEWDADNPYLYRLVTRLLENGRVIQEESCRIGFKDIEMIPDKGLYINGKHCKFQGVCEHHDLGALGAAFHKEAMARKIRILKSMGVNAIRLTHNMAAEGVLELADEMGIYLISEGFDMWERPKTTYDYARFFPKWHEKDVASWIRRDRNHASVVLWSIGNEIYDTHADARGREVTADLQKQVLLHDPLQNARVTIGSNYMQWEGAQNCADILKLAGYNYGERLYPEHHAAHPDWVIYGSETSSIVQSRGVYHFPLASNILSDDDEQCSALGNSTTSWSAVSYEACVTIDRDTPYSLGQFLWSGFDYIGEPTPYHTKNSYFGQIDTAGFPKDSYYVWKAAWTDVNSDPMVHIFPYWDFNRGQRIDLRVVSNAPNVELFLNGKSLGKQKLTNKVNGGSHIIADYQALYEPGTLLAIATDENGKEVAREEKHSFGDAVELEVKPSKGKFDHPGDLIFLEISALDGDSNPVENASNRVHVFVDGPARLVGLDNGDSTDLDSYKGTSKRLFHGKLLAILEAGNDSGIVVVTVTSRNMEPKVFNFLSAVEENAPRIVYDRAMEQTEYIDECRDYEIVNGKAYEIPVRKLEITAADGQQFTAEQKVLHATVKVLPEGADDQEVTFTAVNDKGVETSLVSLETKGHEVTMTALGDGDFFLRATSKSGTEKVRVISQLEYSVTGVGQASFDPYHFVSGALYTGGTGSITSGNEKGIATGRMERTVVCFDGLDFGPAGSDEVTIPIFNMGESKEVNLYLGNPDEGGILLAKTTYEKEMIWGVYQDHIVHFDRRICGKQTLAIEVFGKMHIKGFVFKKEEKAFLSLPATSADAIYGDTFIRKEEGIYGIGNNVAMDFEEMDFGEEGTTSVTIKGRARGGKNTVHLRFLDAESGKEIRQIAEFEPSEEVEEKTFTLEKVTGKQKVTFIFLPGCDFDFVSFRFET